MTWYPRGFEVRTARQNRLDKIQTLRMVEERIQASEKETTTEGVY
jgi:hypothetical protein